MLKRILMAATLTVLVTTMTQAAHASPAVALILKNQGAANATTSDDLNIWSPNPRTAPAGGQITGFKDFGGSDVFSNVTVTDTLSNAKCTFHTQSVFSSFFGHYQITATTPGVFNATDGSGRTATCTQTFTFRLASTGDYDSTMTVSFQ